MNLIEQEATPGIDSTASKRFFDKVDKFGPPWNGTPCWDWIGAKHKAGYGFFWAGKAVQAHRFSYANFCGEIPTGLVIDHLCRRPACVNPLHLEAVASRVNILRGISHSAVNSRKTECINGHLLSAENIYPYKGARHCLQCKADRADRLNKETMRSMELRLARNKRARDRRNSPKARGPYHIQLAVTSTLAVAPDAT